MMMIRACIYLSFLVFLAGCAGSAKLSRSAAAYSNYQEDLSATRPTFPELPQESSPLETPVANASSGAPVDADLDEALASYARKNANKDYQNGFTILVYSGVDRETAFDTRNQLYSTLPSKIKAEMEYHQPRYLVKVGRFSNRIEAQSLFHAIKKEFPSARIIQQRFRNKEVEEEVEEIKQEG